MILGQIICISPIKRSPMRSFRWSGNVGLWHHSLLFHQMNSLIWSSCSAGKTWRKGWWFKPPLCWNPNFEKMCLKWKCVGNEVSGWMWIVMCDWRVCVGELWLDMSCSVWLKRMCWWVVNVDWSYSIKMVQEMFSRNMSNGISGEEKWVDGGWVLFMWFVVKVVEVDSE